MTQPSYNIKTSNNNKHHTCRRTDHTGEQITLVTEVIFLQTAKNHEGYNYVHFCTLLKKITGYTTLHVTKKIVVCCNEDVIVSLSNSLHIVNIHACDVFVNQHYPDVCQILISPY